LRARRLNSASGTGVQGRDNFKKGDKGSVCDNTQTNLLKNGAKQDAKAQGLY